MNITFEIINLSKEIDEEGEKVLFNVYDEMCKGLTNMANAAGMTLEEVEIAFDMSMESQAELTSKMFKEDPSTSNYEVKYYPDTKEVVYLINDDSFVIKFDLNE